MNKKVLSFRKTLYQKGSSPNRTIETNQSKRRKTFTQNYYTIDMNQTSSLFHQTAQQATPLRSKIASIKTKKLPKLEDIELDHQNGTFGF